MREGQQFSAAEKNINKNLYTLSERERKQSQRKKIFL
jgi:hypothetical protein